MQDLELREKTAWSRGAMRTNDVGERGWRIGELGRRMGMNPKTIRYYEEAGLVPPPARTASGYRIYSETDAGRLAFIRAAKDFGFTLGEIREILAVRDRNEAPCPYVVGLAREKLADLQDRIARLKLLSGDLEEMLQEVESEPSEERTGKGEYCHMIERPHRTQQTGTP